MSPGSHYSLCPSCKKYETWSPMEKYCAECGTELVMECPNCHNKLFKQGNFCPICGGRIINQ
ncbi:MAG: double zinc ribbon domain-containing protein [Syntrophobacteraceae bacterium]